jgi:hypothetical protein
MNSNKPINLKPCLFVKRFYCCSPQSNQSVSLYKIDSERYVIYGTLRELPTSPQIIPSSRMFIMRSQLDCMSSLY